MKMSTGGRPRHRVGEQTRWTLVGIGRFTPKDLGQIDDLRVGPPNLTLVVVGSAASQVEF